MLGPSQTPVSGQAFKRAMDLLIVDLERNIKLLGTPERAQVCRQASGRPGAGALALKPSALCMPGVRAWA